MTEPTLTPAERLRHPLSALKPAALLELWRRVTIVVRCARPPQFDGGPGLTGRLRGAFGRRLWDAAILTHLPADPAGRTALPLYDLLFGEHGRQIGGSRRPKPFVLGAELRAGGIEVTLTLFGFAGFWFAAAAQTLCEALEAGIAIADQARVRARLRVSEYRIERIEGVPPPAAGGAVRLHFATPFVVAQGGALTLAPAALIASLANRIRGLARWHDLDLDMDWPKTLARAAELTLTEPRLTPWLWDRRSTRSGPRAIPMRGLSGAFTLSGDLAPFLPLLAIGETTHLGSGTTFGLGRYVLQAQPDLG
jgi:hypothetical protein